MVISDFVHKLLLIQKSRQPAKKTARQQHISPALLYKVKELRHIVYRLAESLLDDVLAIRDKELFTHEPPHFRRKLCLGEYDLARYDYLDRWTHDSPSWHTCQRQRNHVH